MKKITVLFLLLGVTWIAQAETVLICHAQSIPEGLQSSFRSTLAKTLVDRIFDYYFTHGDIAFDNAINLAEAAPSDAWLGSLSSRLGADKVVYIHAVWAQGGAKEAVLTRVEYRILRQGLVLKAGDLAGALVSPSREELKQVALVSDQVMADLTS